jgi:outer membrane receptor protein involved in Fe transport
MTVFCRSRILLCLRLAAAGAAALCGGTAAAQERVIEEVQVTATRIGGEDQPVSEAVTVVNTAELADAQIQVVTDALRGQSGVFVQQTTPGQGTAIVRGLKGSEVLHLVDGMRLNNALFRNAPNQYLALVDPFIAERIEVVRGPLSTLYGSDAMGGAVQVITDRPFLGGGDWAVDGRALVRFDSRTLGNVVHSSLAAGAGDWGFGGALSYQDHGDVRAANRRAQSPSGYRSEAASAFVSFQPREGQRNELSVQYLTQPSTPRHDELVAGFGQTEPASEIFEFAPNSRLFVHAQHHSTGWSSWVDELSVHLGMQKMTDDRRTQDTGADALRVEQNDSELWGLTISAAAVPSERHAVTYGVDVYRDTVHSARQSVAADGTAQSIQSRFPDGSKLNTLDVYVQDAMTLSPRVALTAGARISRAEVALAATEETEPATIRNTDITGSLGLRADLDDQWTLLANLGRGFRAPNIFDLGTLGARPGNRFNIANTDLGPETVWTLDSGLRFENAVASVEAFVWYSDYQDQIISVSSGALDAAGRDIVQSQNASSVILRGAEIVGEWRFAPGWRANFGVNYVWGETTLTDEEEPADRIPPLDAQFTLRYERDLWWIDAQARVAAGQDRLSGRDVRDPRINPDGTPGFGLLRLRGSYQFSSVLRATLALHNLADKTYREHGSGIDGAGRAASLTIEGRF